MLPLRETPAGSGSVTVIGVLVLLGPALLTVTLYVPLTPAMKLAGPVMAMSGVSREGLIEVLRALRGQIDEDRLRHKVAAAPVEDTTWRP